MMGQINVRVSAQESEAIRASFGPGPASEACRQLMAIGLRHLMERETLVRVSRRWIDSQSTFEQACEAFVAFEDARAAIEGRQGPLGATATFTPVGESVWGVNEPEGAVIPLLWCERMDEDGTVWLRKEESTDE